MILEVEFNKVGMSLYMRFFLRILRLGCFDRPCFRKLIDGVQLWRVCIVICNLRIRRMVHLVFCILEVYNHFFCFILVKIVIYMKKYLKIWPYFLYSDYKHWLDLDIKVQDSMLQHFLPFYNLDIVLYMNLHP